MVSLEHALSFAAMTFESEKDRDGNPSIFYPIKHMLKLTTDEERITAILFCVLQKSIFNISEIKDNLNIHGQIEDSLKLLYSNSSTYIKKIDQFKKNVVAKNVLISFLEDWLFLGTYYFETKGFTFTESTLEDIKNYVFLWNTLKEV